MNHIILSTTSLRTHALSYNTVLTPFPIKNMPKVLSLLRKSRSGFGWIQGLENEWGYVNLYYLESRRGPGGAKVERDLHFQPTTFSQMLHLKA